ncbi:MAG: hypothetical protein Q9191_000466 [Dirinaria sp. TL-2023a]
MAETPAAMYGIATSMTILALVAIALRFYARHIKKTGYSWDDWMILPAMLFTIATAICMFVGAADGQLAQHVELKNHHPHWTNRIKVFDQTFYVVSMTTVLTFGFTKLAVLLFYKRIFTGKVFKALIWVMIVLSFVWTVGFFFSQLLQCVPLSVNWSKYGGTTAQCIDVNKMILAQAWSDVFTNVVILALPIPCIWRMQMPISRKLGVCAIFLLGALTVGTGIAKLVIFYRVLGWLNGINNYDITYEETPMVYWPMVESSLGIIGACLPLMRPLFAGAASHGFMRHLHTFKSSDEGSDTFWDHSDNTRLAKEWNSTLATTTNWGSVGSGSTKLGSGGPLSSNEKFKGSVSTVNFGSGGSVIISPNLDAKA